jgi:hypothetical protein
MNICCFPQNEDGLGGPNFLSPREKKGKTGVYDLCGSWTPITRDPFVPLQHDTPLTRSGETVIITMINALVGLYLQACQWPSVLANCAIERGAKGRKITEFLFPHFILGGEGEGSGLGKWRVRRLLVFKVGFIGDAFNA